MTEIDPQRVVIPPDDPAFADLMEKVRTAWEAGLLVADVIGYPGRHEMEAFLHVVTALFNVARLPGPDLSLVLGALLAMGSFPCKGEAREDFITDALEQIARTLEDLSQREAAGNPGLRTQ